MILGSPGQSTDESYALRIVTCGVTARPSSPIQTLLPALAQTAMQGDVSD